MNRRELMQAMIELGASWPEANDIYREAFDSLAERMVRSSAADIPGVGTFSAHHRHQPAYQAVNPFTRQPLIVPARDHLRVLFAPDSALVAAIGAKGAGGPPLEVPGLLGGAFLAALSGRRPEITLPAGTFRTIKLPAQRALLHPRTGAVIRPALPAQRDVRFRPSSKLKAALLAALRDR